MTMHRLQQRLSYWQERLNLKEWRIALRWGTANDAPEHGEILGSCSWMPEDLVADIQITRRSPAQEETLVHELLHILLGGHTTMEARYNLPLERAINKIAAALIASETH